MGATTKPREIPTTQRVWFWTAVLAFLCGVYVALRVRGMASLPLWHDEVFSALFAKMGWRDMFRAIISEAVHPPLFYVFLKGWTSFCKLRLLMWQLPILFSLLTLAPRYLRCRERGLCQPVR